MVKAVLQWKFKGEIGKDEESWGDEREEKRNRN